MCTDVGVRQDDAYQDFVQPETAIREVAMSQLQRRMRFGIHTKTIQQKLL